MSEMRDILDDVTTQVVDSIVKDLKNDHTITVLPDGACVIRAAEGDTRRVFLDFDLGEEAGWSWTCWEDPESDLEPIAWGGSLARIADMSDIKSVALAVAQKIREVLS